MSKEKKHIVEIVKEFSFAASHALTKLPQKHACRALHGHTYKIEVKVRGTICKKEQWVLDFKRISQIVNPIIKKHLDHKHLNDIKELNEQPTCEMLAIWLWNIAHKKIPGLFEIVVHETATSRCIYRGETTST